MSQNKESIEQLAIELHNRNYAYKTTSLYISYLEKFLCFAREHPELSPEDRIARFLDTYSSRNESRRLAWCEILAFYRFVLKKPVLISFRMYAVEKGFRLFFQKVKLLPSSLQYQIQSTEL